MKETKGVPFMKHCVYSDIFSFICVMQTLITYVTSKNTRIIRA